MRASALFFATRRRSLWLGAIATIATTLLACSALAPEGAESDDAGTPTPTDDAGATGAVDAAAGDSTVDAAPVNVQHPCASATTPLAPATPATSGDLTLACGGALGEVSLENCFCPASSPVCPDPIYGIPGAWNPNGGCGFCMSAGAVLCGTVAGTPYSCPAGSNCGTFTPDAAAGYACCPAGQTCTSLCSGVCVPGTTQCSDGGVQNCGNDDTWGSASPCTGQACVGGACVGVCTPGPGECSDGGGIATCNANGQWDLSPCTDSYCLAGKCVSNCVTGRTQCVGNALQTCGPDGTWASPVACQAQACEDGGCVGSCAPGTTSCSGNAPETCNAVGEWDAGPSCPAPTTECNASTCVCPNGGTLCGDVCSDLADNANCGQCGVTCSATGESCMWGACFCPSGEAPCGGACTNLESDLNNCGTCGVTCSATGQSCDAGVCACATGSVVCNGACLDVRADPNNCGGCGVTCAGTCAGAQCLSALIANRSSPGAIVADGNYVAWTEPNAGNVMVMLPDGGSVRAVATNQGSPTSIADDYGTAYWTNTTSGEIMKASLASGAAVPFATNQATPTTIAVTDALGASWIVNDNTIEVEQFEGNTSVTTWFTGTELSGLAIGSGVLWCDGGEVFYGGGFSQTPMFLSSAQMPCAFSLPEEEGTDYVVWTNSLSTDAVYAWNIQAHFTVNGAPPPAVIATGPATQTRTAITQDGVSVYWANSDGTIMKVAITGGTPVTVAAGQGTPGGIALDSTSLYWTSSSAGTVMKLTPR